VSRRLQRTAWLITGLLVLLLLAAVVIGGVEPALAMLKQLEAVVERHFWLALAGFILGFIALVLLGLPIGTLFCLCGGYLFGVLIGALAALAGASLGALATFLLVRRMGGRRLREKLDTGVSDTLLTELERDAGWYLVLLRVIPFAPFFPVNAAAAMTAIHPSRFTLGTVIGLTPTTLLYAAIGNGVGSVLEAEELVGPDLWLRPSIWLPVSGLVLLLLFGLVWHHRKAGNPH
jgi:uncharacterized membrane protein YdjX (TVP38/TMEM64 family)